MEVSTQAAVNKVRQINFVCEGEKARSVSTRQISGQLKAEGAWEMWADIKKLVFSAHIISTQLRPDLLLRSD